MGDDLPVGEGEVRRGGHRPEVASALLGLQGSAAELPVGKVDAVLPGGLQHVLEEVVADLVAEAPGAGVDADRDAPRRDADRPGRLLVEDLVDDLHLHEVIPRAEGPELRAAALLRPRAHQVRPRLGEAAALLDPGEILLTPEAPLDRPAGAAREQGVVLVLGHAEVLAMGADAGGDVLEEAAHQGIDPALDVGP